MITSKSLCVEKFYICKFVPAVFTLKGYAFLYQEFAGYRKVGNENGRRT